MARIQKPHWLRATITAAFVIGVIATYTYYSLYGWEALKKTLLTWVIGAGLVVPAIAWLLHKLKKHKIKLI